MRLWCSFIKSHKRDEHSGNGPSGNAAERISGHRSARHTSNEYVNNAMASSFSARVHQLMFVDRDSLLTTLFRRPFFTLDAESSTSENVRVSE